MNARLIPEPLYSEVFAVMSEVADELIKTLRGGDRPRTSLEQPREE
jgi:hypothetical protein